jgi:hypothetical protein
MKYLGKINLICRTVLRSQLQSPVSQLQPLSGVDWMSYSAVLQTNFTPPPSPTPPPVCRVEMKEQPASLPASQHASPPTCQHPPSPIWCRERGQQQCKYLPGVSYHHHCHSTPRPSRLPHARTISGMCRCTRLGKGGVRDARRR